MPVPRKTSPILPPSVNTPTPNIDADAVGTLAAAFLALPTKVQLNSILRCKWKNLIYSSDATSIERRDNGFYMPSEHISALVADLYNSIYAPMDDSKSELDLHTNMIVLGNNCFVLEWYGKSFAVNPLNYCLESFKDVSIIDAAISYYCPYSPECYILIFQNALYLPDMKDNLLSPFIMREIGATVNDSKDHCIKFA